MPYTVYAMSNADDTHIYVGCTKNLKNRSWKHLNECKKNKHPNRHVQALYNLIGPDDIEFDVVHTCDTKEEAHEVEQQWVDYYLATPEWQLLNIATEDVSSPSCNPEVAAKISAVLKGKGCKPIYVKYQSGQELTFPTGNDAAKHIGCSPTNTLYRWLKGKSTSYTKPKYGCIAEIRYL